MAKRELFRGPLGPLLLRLGAFPVQRGATDTEAIETARSLLEAGELLVLFPEGTRVDEADALGAPHHGAGRLALVTRRAILAGRDLGDVAVVLRAISQAASRAHRDPGPGRAVARPAMTPTRWAS